MNYPDYPELFMHDLKIKGHVTDFKKSVHVPDFNMLCGKSHKRKLCLRIIQVNRKPELRMRKMIFFLIGLFFLFQCGADQAGVERIMEDGVEVVINHLQPYKIKSEPASLILDEELIIDFESDDIATLGISDITGFNVDSSGNIYVGSLRSTENFIFKFNEEGKYVGSFCHVGQGPGEVERLGSWRINESDEILIANRARDKLIVLDTFGNLIREIPLASNHIIATVLKSGKILAMQFLPKPGEGLFYPIVISNIDLENPKTLRQGQRLQNYVAAKELNGLELALDYAQWSISKEYIYIGNKFNGYEFLVYDLNGTLVKKIRKDYNPVKVSQKLKDTVIKSFDTPSYNQDNIKDKIFFPNNMPPFQYFFSDDVGRLYVMTYEKGEEEKDFIYDIFNSGGTFISRTVIDNSGNILGAPPFQELSNPCGGPYDVRVKYNRLYYLRGKESGFQELVVCEMKWE
jgi:hypothetical protein